MSLSCFSDIDSAIFFEAPLRLDFFRSPRLAARAAPAAICCFFDLGWHKGLPTVNSALRNYFAAAPTLIADFASFVNF